MESRYGYQFGFSKSVLDLVDYLNKYLGNYESTYH